MPCRFNSTVRANPTFSFRHAVAGAITFLALSTLSTLQAGEKIVNFAPKADATCNGQGRADGQIRFSMSEARSPKPGGSKNYGGENSVFYGGAVATRGSINQFRFNTSDSSIQVRLTGEKGCSAAAVILWKKDDFVAGSDATNISIGRGDSLAVNSRRFGSDIERELRFVIQEKGVFYVSAPTSGIPSSYKETSIKNPASAKWFAFDPTSSISAIGKAANPTFQNIESVGVWFKVTKTKVGTATVAIKGFTANGTLVSD